MIINHNMGSINANRMMGINQANSSKSMEKLSSGLRINRAGDDAAGLAISEKMRGQIRGLDQASSNAQDAISLIQTAEGALNETHSILQRMRELSVQASNDTNVTADRTAIQEEMNALTKEVDRIAKDTEFNTQSLLSGKFDGTFQIGANGGQNISLKIDAMDSANLGLTATTSMSEEVASAKGAGTGAAVKAGVYTVKGTDILDDKGEKVGSIAGKVATFGDTTNNTTVTVAGDNLKDGDKLTFDADTAADGTGATVKVETKTDLTTEGKKIASGDYEIKGDIVLRDGKEVGNLKTTGTYTIDGIDIKASDLGRTTALADGSKFSIDGVDVSNQDKASGAIGVINDAIELVSTQRSKLGAVQNRLEHTINNLNTSSENLTSAESRIRDVDMAKEMSEYSKNNILSQAAQSMLAQANQQPQQVLQLLQ